MVDPALSVDIIFSNKKGLGVSLKIRVIDNRR